MRVYILQYPKHIVRLFLLANWMGNAAGFIGDFYLQFVSVSVSPAAAAAEVLFAM